MQPKKQKQPKLDANGQAVWGSQYDDLQDEPTLMNRMRDVPMGISEDSEPEFSEGVKKIYTVVGTDYSIWQTGNGMAYIGIEPPKANEKGKPLNMLLKWVREVKAV